MQDQDGDVELGEVLLCRKVPINGDENIEGVFRQGQKPAVFDPGPPHLGNGLDGMVFELLGQPAVQAITSFLLLAVK